MFAAPGERLYPIVDSEICAARGLNPLAVARAYLDGGAQVLQLRVKTGSSAAFLNLAEETVAAASSAGAAVIINDRSDIARIVAAAGVHVGQDDLPPEAVRQVLGSGVIGLSTHDVPQIEAALASTADYVAVGPVFSTTTKDTGYTARGLDLIAEASGRGKPVVAIGGINLENAAQVIEAGAAAVAVISDLLASGDAAARVRDYLRVLR